METQVIAMARLKKLGVKLVSVDEPSIDSISRRNDARCSSWQVSQFYSHNLSTRVKHRFQHHREQGRWLHKAPLGYRNVQQMVVKSIALDDAAPLLKQAFEMIASGQHSSEEVRSWSPLRGYETRLAGS